MRTIIAGSRTANSYDDLLASIAAIDWTPSEIISGTARGADMLGERWARENNIPLRRMPADWDKYGKSAGYIRNMEMLRHADALIAIWDGQSKGTSYMIKIAQDKGLRIFIQRI